MTPAPAARLERAASPVGAERSHPLSYAGSGRTRGRTWHLSHVGRALYRLSYASLCTVSRLRAGSQERSLPGPCYSSPRANPPITCGVAVSNPTTSSMPASFGSAIREAVRDHSDHDQLGRDAACSAVAAQRLGRVHVPSPGLVVGVDHERVDRHAVLVRVAHRQGAVGAAERQLADTRDDIVQPLPRRDRQRREAVGRRTAPLPTQPPRRREGDDSTGSTASVTSAIAAAASRGESPARPRPSRSLIEPDTSSASSMPLARSARRSRSAVERRRRAHRRFAVTGVQVACAAHAPPGRVGAQPRQHARSGGRGPCGVRSPSPQPLGDEPSGGEPRREQANSRHRRQVSDHRRHRHVSSSASQTAGRSGAPSAAPRAAAGTRAPAGRPRRPTRPAARGCSPRRSAASPSAFARRGRSTRRRAARSSCPASACRPAARRVRQPQQVAVRPAAHAGGT